MKAFNLFVAVLVIAVKVFAADPLTERLQRGLFEEEANHNLDAAIKEYQSVVTQSDEQRKVIATALFRLGECYRKLGRTNDADAQYRRILSDFSEQDALVKLSRSLTMNTTVAPTAPATLPAEPMTQAETDALARVKTLARNSPDLLEISPGGGFNELQNAARSGFYSVAEFLVAQGVKVDGTSTGYTPLVVATQGGHLRMVKLLVEKGARVNPPSGGGQSALMAAASFGFQSIIAYLVEHGADVNYADGAGGTALISAVAGDRLNAVEYLLAHGANPNALSRSSFISVRRTGSNDQFGGTPLHRAVASDNQPLAEMLIRAGANVKATNLANQTPLHTAAHVNSSNLCVLLLDHGAEVDAAPDGNTTPLHQALLQKSAKATAVLVQRGANPNRTYLSSGTVYQPVTLAADFGEPELLSALLMGKPSLNFTNYRGDPPLISAINQNRPAIVSLLLRAGANSNETNRTGEVPIVLAAQAADAKTVEALLSYKADPNQTNAKGKSALEWALHYSRSPATGEAFSPIPGRGVSWVTPETKAASLRIVDLLRQHGAKEPPAATNNPASPSGVPGVNTQGYLNGVPVPVAPQLPSPARAPGAAILPANKP